MCSQRKGHTIAASSAQKLQSEGVVFILQSLPSDTLSESFFGVCARDSQWSETGRTTGDTRTLEQAQEERGGPLSAHLNKPFVELFARLLVLRKSESSQELYLPSLCCVSHLTRSPCNCPSQCWLQTNSHGWRSLNARAADAKAVLAVRVRTVCTHEHFFPTTPHYRQRAFTCK